MILMMYMCNQFHYEIIQLCNKFILCKYSKKCVCVCVCVIIILSPCEVMVGWQTSSCGWKGESSNFTLDMSWTWHCYDTLS
jgi:hypothetical protein